MCIHIAPHDPYGMAPWPIVPTFFSCHDIRFWLRSHLDSPVISAAEFSSGLVRAAVLLISDISPLLVIIFMQRSRSRSRSRVAESNADPVAQSNAIDPSTTDVLLAMLDEMDEDREPESFDPPASSGRMSEAGENANDIAIGRILSRIRDEDEHAEQEHEQIADNTPLRDMPAYLHSEEFWKSVTISLQEPRMQLWCKCDFFDHAPADFASCLIASASFITGSISGTYQYKIGITNNIMGRWLSDEIGYALNKKHPWLFMAILYAAPTSKPAVPYSTGCFEKQLCALLAYDPDCINRMGAGADCPSRGSPHFCYVAVRAHLD